MNDCDDCPIPNTHQKFREATYFLGRCAKEYHVPSEFIFNLNAFIQALRNITFMLQSEQSRPEKFATWYETKQAEMRKNDLLRRFVNARNIVVKQSSLELRSTAESGVFRYRRLKLGISHSLPLFTPSSLILERLRVNVGFFLDEAHSQPWEQFGIQRTWIVNEIGDAEVLGLSLQALNSVWAVVVEAHQLFGAEVDCAELNLDMVRTQTFLESDMDSSLIAKWGWNGSV